MSGEDPISPAAPIHVGQHWNVEHVWPTALVGWIVLVLRRHAEALHDLSDEEFTEFGELLGAATSVLGRQTGCLKEYVCCFAEAEGFSHVHVHVVPRPPDLSPELLGPGVFDLLGPDTEPAKREDVLRFCDTARELFVSEMSRR